TSWRNGYPSWMPSSRTRAQIAKGATRSQRPRSVVRFLIAVWVMASKVPAHRQRGDRWGRMAGCAGCGVGCGSRPASPGAGRSTRRSVTETADRFHDVERTAALNYLGPVQLLLALLPGLRATGGHIVNVSTAGLAVPAAANWSAYLASKAAFDTWLRSAAIE